MNYEDDILTYVTLCFCVLTELSSYMSHSLAVARRYYNKEMVAQAEDERSVVDRLLAMAGALIYLM